MEVFDLLFRLCINDFHLKYVCVSFLFIFFMKRRVFLGMSRTKSEREEEGRRAPGYGRKVGYRHDRAEIAEDLRTSLSSGGDCSALPSSPLSPSSTTLARIVRGVPGCREAHGADSVPSGRSLPLLQPSRRRWSCASALLVPHVILPFLRNESCTCIHTDRERCSVRPHWTECMYVSVVCMHKERDTVETAVQFL